MANQNIWQRGNESIGGNGVALKSESWRRKEWRMAQAKMPAKAASMAIMAKAYHEKSGAKASENRHQRRSGVKRRKIVTKLAAISSEALHRRSRGGGIMAAVEAALAYLVSMALHRVSRKSQRSVSKASVIIESGMKAAK